MRVGVSVTCTQCGLDKQPHGRSAPVGACYCDWECPGYNRDPRPGCLWPGETEVEFGHNSCASATKEVSQ